MPDRDVQPLTYRVDSRNIAALLDTNVILEMYSSHDLLAVEANMPVALEVESRLLPQDAAGASAKRQQVELFRVRRAANALALAIHFHETQAFTLCLEEAVTKIVQCVAPGGGTAAENYIIAYRDFVRPRALPGWTNAKVPNVPLDLAGDAADAELVVQARKYGWPLITNEGNSHEGIKDVRLRKAAKDAGVRVFTPGEFVKGKMKRNMRRGFLDRFKANRSKYREGESDFSVAQASLDGIYEYYCGLLSEEP